MRSMVPILRILLTGLPLAAVVCAEAQTFAKNTIPSCKPPISRVLWHDKIDNAQKAALRADGKADELFYTGANDDVNYFVTQSLTKKVDEMQCRIETDTALREQAKIMYLKGLDKVIQNFTVSYRNRQFTASKFPTLLTAYEEAMAKEMKKESIEPVVEKNSYEIGRILVASGAFDGNKGLAPSRHLITYKYCLLYPERIFATLKENPEVPFRDSLIVFAGKKYPKILYDYAAANNRLGNAIQKVEDPFVRTIAKMARSGGSGQLYFPFLDNIITGSQTIEQIDAVKEDGQKYYQLLVKTRMDYVRRATEGETITAMESLNKMLIDKGKAVFIKEINALHEKPDAVRFKILQGLNAQELYYLVIAGEGEVYTSSYLKGIYPLMMQRAGNRGDSLLMSVGFDRFKKFLKIAAGYHTLANFLGSFPDKSHTQVLMTAFVNNLEKSSGLEDGVDVADSYASIVESMPDVAKEMVSNVKRNYDRNATAGNKRGSVMYDLLYKLFQSATDSTINLSKTFGIPPVYSIPYQNLVDDSAKKVVTQVFFYGDEDGRRNYAMFLPQFANAGWKKVEDNKQWVAFASTKGKPVVIYANKPLDEQSGEIDRAQAALNEYLAKKSIQPTIIIHRGHSYYAPYTIEQIQPAAKIVFLGSCGGYHLIHDVLKHAPDAHIISSKQIGKEVINRPFIDLINEKLRNGSNIDWMPFWKEFTAKAGKVEGFEDYIPPHKNLGAIFIKAYGSAMGEDVASGQ